jgi:hypothetical protein
VVNGQTPYRKLTCPKYNIHLFIENWCNIPGDREGMKTPYIFLKKSVFLRISGIKQYITIALIMKRNEALATKKV